MGPMLQMKGISKSFPGVKALNRVDFAVKPGEVHCLIGANGAGKSTLMKILSGVYPMDEGEIIINDATANIHSPKDSKALGIATIYQELSLVEELSVAENIFLGEYLQPKGGFVSWKQLKKSAQALLAELNIHLSPELPIRALSMGTKQMVEITKAIASQSKIIIMDEPSTALSEGEVKTLFRVIRDLKKRGITIIYISHKLDELFTIGDRVTVLRNGEWVFTKEMKEISQTQLVEAIIGRKMEKDRKAAKKTEHKEVFLTVQGFKNEKLKNISFDVKKGEILGLYGLVGAGRTELLKAIFGVDKLIEGKLSINNQVQQVTSPQKAIQLGMGYVPENRKTEGAILDLNVKENAILPSLSKYAQFGFLKQLRIEQAVKTQINRLNIKTRNPDALMRNLSGGNQQKVIISKWLIHESRLLLFDEPTQGIDIGAKDEIYTIIKELAENGTSVIVASSEIEELLLLSDRVLVMYHGEVVHECKSPLEQKDEILHSAVAGAI
ncbi:sugar ABC transporter ATP-binding protein [Bacillus chungangensis]|uniref:Ribose transport system ATP-binding protein n=1 Tax=Bacillus chungangensis TaxID=587633 RepID=A0ABT9WTR8_9BACI|nr:sugar ABC transporter ATP-binding protein [Bacillus chungangensis]MDQ0176622.1 ribose transport system ATP-binding protein [Bacillus chungangensis]